MKNLLLATTAAALISTSAMAMDEFYVGGGVGAARFSRTTDKQTSLKVKSDTSAHAKLIAGAYVTEGVSAELVLKHHISPKKDASGKVADPANPGVQIDASTSHKIGITSLQLRTLVDIFDMGGMKLCAGAQIGAAQVRDTIKNKLDKEYDFKVKNHTNLVYGATLGIRGKMSPGIEARFLYAFEVNGETGSYTNKDIKAGVELGKTRLHNHELSAEIVFGL